MYLLEYTVGEITVQEVWFPLWHGPIEDYENSKDIKIIKVDNESKDKQGSPRKKG